MKFLIFLPKIPKPKNMKAATDQDSDPPARPIGASLFHYINKPCLLF